MESKNEDFRRRTRETLSKMSDAAIAVQRDRYSGGIEGEEIEAEVQRRGIGSTPPYQLSTKLPTN